MKFLNVAKNAQKSLFFKLPFWSFLAAFKISFFSLHNPNNAEVNVEIVECPEREKPFNNHYD